MDTSDSESADRHCVNSHSLINGNVRQPTVISAVSSPKISLASSVRNLIEGWYNPQRRHSSIGYWSPVQYEKRYAARA